MLRLSLAARITMIVMVALLVFWIGAIAHFYRSQAGEGESIRPSPRQIAALVELLEQTQPEKRPLVLEAVSSSGLNAKLEASDAIDVSSTEIRPVGDAIRNGYAAALGNRTLVVTSSPPSEIVGRFPKLFPTAMNAIELHVALNTGETLVVESKSPLPISRFGLPVGFGAGLIGTLVALVALIVMHRETRPLARLSAAVDQMDLAGEPKLLPQARTSAPEIQALITAFNRLQTRLSQLLRAPHGDARRHFARCPHLRDAAASAR